MTKQQLVKFLLDIDSEYLYQDIGYGSFKSESVFIIQGIKIPVSRITKDELVIMLNSYGY